MGSIKDRSGMDLTEAQDTKKRWLKYTEKLDKRDLHDPDNNDGMVTHVERRQVCFRKRHYEQS